MYGQHGEVKAIRGNIHDYLGMTFRFRNGEVKIDMVDYIEEMLKDFAVKFSRNVEKTPTAAGIDLLRKIPVRNWT